MRYVLAVSLCLVAASAQAEPYTAWEQNGTIWSRDEAVPGSDWQISRGANCHSPVIDGPLAIWIGDWATPSNVMGRDVAQNFPVDWIVRIASASDPQVSYLRLPDEWAYVAWRENGGIWAKRLRDRPVTPTKEVVGNYTGPYTLEERTLTWDGGSMDLSVLLVPEPAPEPSTLVLLLIGLVCLAVHRRVRR